MELANSTQIQFREQTEVVVIIIPLQRSPIAARHEVDLKLLDNEGRVEVETSLLPSTAHGLFIKFVTTGSYCIKVLPLI